MPPLSPTPEPAETIAPGITREWIANNQIVVFTMATVARSSIDALLNHVKQLMIEWPADRPYLALYHVADTTNGPTPYIRERFRDVQTWRPDLKAHIALVATRNFQGKLIQIYARTRGAVVQMFFSRDEGLAWLKGFLNGASGPG